MPKSSHPEADAIRRHVLTALAENRAPGFHFPGHLLALAWPRIGEDDLEEVMPDGPQARNVDGSINLAAFCVHLDTALATASRLKLERGAPSAPLELNDLEPKEKKVMAACDAALRLADPVHAFIERFWGVLPVPTDAGARCTVRLGPQHGNVGHVQGGLLVGLAALTAQAAAPRHPRLSAIAARYISPGQGRALKIASRRFHEGRSFAAVRTEIRNADGARVLEVVSHHAA